MDPSFYTAPGGGAQSSMAAPAAVWPVGWPPKASSEGWDVVLGVVLVTALLALWIYWCDLSFLRQKADSRLIQGPPRVRSVAVAALVAGVLVVVLAAVVFRGG
jgi:hypothetical protein